MIYFISDTHFWHRNIIKYTKRPFETVEQMNEHIIKCWNEVVSPDDVVYHLGDFSFGSSEQVANIIERLNGKIILIMGNHDKSRTVTWWLRNGIHEVHKGSMIIEDYILSHKPLIHVPYGMINVHGHIHDLDISVIEGYDEFDHINVCVEKTGFYPIILP